MSHYHSQLKGCTLIKFYVRFRNDKTRWIEARYCITHKTICCRCGYEFGHHYNSVDKLCN